MRVTRDRDWLRSKIKRGTEQMAPFNDNWKSVNTSNDRYQRSRRRKGTQREERSPPRDASAQVTGGRDHPAANRAYDDDFRNLSHNTQRSKASDKTKTRSQSTGARGKTSLGREKTSAGLSGSSTQVKSTSNQSDTLTNDCFVLEGMGFHQITVSDHITPEMSGLNGLVDILYTQLCATSTHFSRYIAKSVFACYCCTLAYARLLRLAQLSGIEVTHDEVVFIDFIDSSTFEVPEALSLYLAAFGKTSLASGVTEI